MRTALVNNREMTSPEIEQYVSETRPYTLSRTTINARIREGLTGEDLIAPPQDPNSRWKKSWPGVVKVRVPGWGYAGANQ